MTPFIQVVTTVEKKKEAERISNALVTAHLAACVQVSKCKSIYNWRGEVQNSQEWVLTIKSSQALFTELCRTIEDLHTYEVPEIIAVPILFGSEKYLCWLKEELKEAEDVD